MPTQIRPALLDSDEAVITDLLKRHLEPTADHKRFRWLYRDSPHGEARAWLAGDSQGNAVGLAAAFPRRMRVRGVEKRNWVLGDFCLDEQYRSLGPALQLQKACLSLVPEASGEFCYDFPSAGMMAIYRRLGIRFESEVIRWVMPIRAERKLERLFRSKKLARYVGPAANFVLSRRGRKRDSAYDMGVHERAFGEEFNVLDQALRNRQGICTIRNADYLNWRYLAHPTRAHEVLTARSAGELAGYIVFDCQGENANIIDICSVDEPKAITSLLAAAVDLVRKRGADNMNLCAAAEHPWQAIFERCGFLPREASPLVVFASSQIVNETFKGPANWYLMQGERDS